MPAAYLDWSRPKTKRHRWNLKIGEVSEYDPENHTRRAQYCTAVLVLNLRRSLPAPDQHDDQWRFCPRCGEPIEYEKAEPVQWREQNCEKCGRPLIQLVQDRRPFFRANYEYVGASLCRDCLEEHCVQTNCLQCDIGNWPGCRYADIKRQGLQKAKEGGENDV